MDAVVNEFPPPPAYYKDFIDDLQPPFPPPSIPSHIETYGGTIPIPDLELTNNQIESHLLPNQLKEMLSQFIQQALYFISDRNRREPIDAGVTHLELLLNNMYEILSKYRIHEARENVCLLLHQELSALTESKAQLERVYLETKSIIEQPGEV